MLDFIKNKTINLNRYRTHSEAVIVACYFNPQKSPYRTKAFKIFYDSIKHLNYRIVECVIGDTEPELDKANPWISRVYTGSTLWHKESLLNGVIAKLPKEFKYVFWLDADVIFTNLNWLVEGAQILRLKNIIQPFETCCHLEQDQLKPDFDLNEYTDTDSPHDKNPRVWHSFCSNYVRTQYWKDEKYDLHGHVGFAWGARRDVLDKVPLYDKGLIGGADHIIAHAAAGQIDHPCISKAFTDAAVMHEINLWSCEFANVINARIGYVKGNLYHIWHGDVEKRQYLKRIQEFTETSKKIVDKDENGLYIDSADASARVKKYFKQREVPPFINDVVTPAEIIYLMNDDVLDILQNVQIIDEYPDIPTFSGFSGGESGGGGAGGTWDDNNDNGSDTFSTDSSNENFS